MSAPGGQNVHKHRQACTIMCGLPMTITGFTGSVSQETSCGSGTEFVPPSFTLILK